MSTYEERREEERKYRGDVFYEVWRRGRNPDNIDYDRLSEYRSQGFDAHEAAAHELHRMRAAEERRRMREQEEEQQCEPPQEEPFPPEPKPEEFQ